LVNGTPERTIKKTYGRKDDDIVKKNYDAVDHTLAKSLNASVTSVFYYHDDGSGVWAREDVAFCDER